MYGTLWGIRGSFEESMRSATACLFGHYPITFQQISTPLRVVYHSLVVYHPGHSPVPFICGYLQLCTISGLSGTQQQKHQGWGRAGGATQAGQAMAWAIVGLCMVIALTWELSSRYQYCALLYTINAHGLTIIFVLPPALNTPDLCYSLSCKIHK